jgi:GlcNAc-P-P-Und epimerase
MKQADYLLTGASGFLGSIILSTLTSSQVSIFTVGRSVGNDLQIDLASHIPEFNCSVDTVIHAAAKAHSVPRSQAEQEEFFEINYNGTVNLLMGLQQAPVLPKSFIFISTVAVYGCDEGLNIDENNSLAGSTSYAKSKIKAEDFLKDWCSKHKVVLTILRLPLLIGSNPPGNFGVMLRAMKRGVYLGIGSGSTKKSMVLAEDVARFIPIVKLVGGIYNLTDGNHPSMFQLEQAMAKQVGVKRLLRVPDRIVKVIAVIGDLGGNLSPINTYKLKKLTSSLTFSDAKARKVGWVSQSVISNLPKFK